jgi:hypothetical protein
MTSTDHRSDPWEPQVHASLSSRWLKGALPVRPADMAEQIGCPVSIAARIMRDHGWHRKRVGEVRGYWPPGFAH